MTPIEIVRLTVELEGVDDPPVRRIVDTSIRLTLDELHEVIQVAMGWENCHLYQFVVAAKTYRVPDIEWDRPCTVIDPQTTWLVELIAEWSNRIAYVYDFGDNWIHHIAITPVGPAEVGIAYPRLVEAIGRCPPEDVGGVPGFCEFLDAMKKPRSKRHRELVEWYGSIFDPNDPNKVTIRKNLVTLAARLKRTRPKVAKTSGH